MSIYKNFLQELLQKEDLIDCSSLAVAVQSSFSKWSREDDANRILRDGDDDYSNHTGKELNPWVKVDCGTSIYPHYILVENRNREPFDKIASSLIVEVSKNDLEYTTLHSGELYFSSLPNGLPLILPCRGNIELRYIRFSISSCYESYLHLKRINILVKKKPNIVSDKGSTIFYSSRTDGLGERLKSLLNAIVLSDVYRSDFRFSWKDPRDCNLAASHSVTSSVDIFSDQFLKKYMIGELSNREVYDLDRRDNRIKNFNNFDGRYIKVSQRKISSQMPQLNGHMPKSSYIDAFKKIEFTDSVGKAIEYARSIEISNEAVGIHLRSGDIVCGRYRYDDRYTNKVISVAQAEYIANYYESRNQTVIVFGQSDQVCSYVADKYHGVYCARSKQYQEFSELQRAIFDVVLMSRCHKVFAGNSGFSQLAEMIGDSEICSIDEVFDEKVVSSFIKGLFETSSYASLDSLQKAFGYWHYVFSYSEIMMPSDIIIYLERAFSHDKYNLFYMLVLAAKYFEAGNIEACEASIAKIPSIDRGVHDKYGRYSFITKMKYPDGKKTLSKYMPVYKKMVVKNVVGAEKIYRDFL